MRPPLTLAGKRTDQGAMEPTHVDWLADGFRVRFTKDPLRRFLTPELILLYALAGIVGGALHLGLLLAWCVPPLLAMWASRRRIATLTVTYSHLVATAPFHKTLRLPLRELREVEVFDGELELHLWGGRRVRVACWAPDRRLQWAVEKIRELRDDAQAYALEMAQQMDAASGVKALTRALPRRRSGAS